MHAQVRHHDGHIVPLLDPYNKPKPHNLFVRILHFLLHVYMF